MATTYTFPKALSLVDYQEPFVTGSKLYSWDWASIVTKKTTNRLTEQVFSYSGFGLPRATGEQAPVYMADMAEHGATTFTMVKYTLGTRFSYETMKYDWHIRDIMKKAGADMGKSHAQLQDTVVAQVFNRATNSSYPVDPANGTAALCASHTMADGTTVNNALTAASLSYDNLWSSVNYFTTSMYDQAGRRIIATPKFVLTHPQNAKLLEKILRANGEPDTVELNNPNLLKDGVAKFFTGLTPIYCPFLTSTTAYFLLDTDFANDLWFFTVESPQYDSEDDFMAHATAYKSWQIFTTGPKDFIHVAYNAGA
jgi:hypothetical protein